MVDDRLEGLLEIERLGDGLGDLRQRFQLGDAALRLRVQLRVLDRLCDLRRDGDGELDLVRAEFTRLDRPHVQRAGEPLARDDRHGEDRLVLILGEIREELEAGIEICLRRNHDRPSLGRGRSGDSLAWAHPRSPSHLLDASPMRCAQNKLVAALLVEVDEARVRVEHVRDLAGNEREHFLEIERRIHRGDRLGEKPQMLFSYVQLNIRSNT